MTEPKKNHQIELSTAIVLLALLFIIGGVTIAIPILYSLNGDGGSLSAPIYNASLEKYVTNECTEKLTSRTVLNAMEDEGAFPYRVFTHLYRPSVIVKSVSVIFGFRHDTRSWSLDKISFNDTTKSTDEMRDGDFESNYLFQNYSQCILSNTRNSISDILFDLPYSGDFYYNDQTNVGMTYLIQKINVIGGRYYNVSYFLENRGTGNNSFVLIIGAS